MTWFETTWAPLARTKGQRVQDRFSLALWRAVLPLQQAVEDLDLAVLEQFKQDRKAGRLPLPGLKANCSARTVGRDLEWLRRVVNLGIGTPKFKLSVNPVTKVTIPDTAQPKRPIATLSRYERLREVADDTGSQRLFGGFLDLLVALGWRVTAVCELRVADIDLEGRRIRKDGLVDKEGVDAWLPVSDWLLPRLAGLLAARHALGVESEYLFPRPTDPTRPWDKLYARARLHVAERKAGLHKLDGGDFHPYRRLWATMRKHLPVGDVAFAGGWKNVTTLQRHYQLVDETTVQAVMNVPLPATHCATLSLVK